LNNWGTSFGYGVLESFVEDRGIWWQWKAVQINDLAINDQLNEGGVPPFCSHIHVTRERGFWIGEPIDISRRRLDENTRGFNLEKICLLTTHQDDGSTLAYDLQEMRPGGLKFLPFSERDEVEPVRIFRSFESAGLLS